MTTADPQQLEDLAIAARRKVGRSLAKHRRLIENLQGDLAKHGDPELWRRYGDLLLANATTAERQGDMVLVTDYFSDTAPAIAIEGASNRSISEIAENYFRKYTKARNAQAVVRERMAKTEAALADAESRLAAVEAAAAAGDEEFLRSVLESGKVQALPVRRKKTEPEIKGVRKFISSDGLTILVGKRASDNDTLTFRIARSLDLWLHAADYPGSHVVVRSPSRNFVIPDRTLTEAAQLAAFYSDARSHPRAAVHYTQKKFVNKPKRAAPGLVSLASFKTILVEPKVAAVLSEREQG
jgi:predicted ribosome quality control (RQC) complex YloA/Tae2 family protein